MTCADSLTMYKIEMKVQGIADSTIKNYTFLIRRFIEFNKIENVENLEPQHITVFKNSLLDSNVGGVSINCYMASLRSYFKFLHEQRYLSEDMSLLKTCKNFKDSKAQKIRGKNQTEDSDEQTGRAITKTERKLLIKTALRNTRPIEDSENTIGQRNALMIRTDIICGMRISDLVTLKVKNFKYDKENEEWKLEYTAQKTDRKVSFYVCNDSLMNDLQAYIYSNNLSADDYIFLAKHGSCMTSQVFWETFKNICKEAEILDIAPHDMRRTCATMLYQQGVPLKVISNRLGHANTAITEAYLRIDENIDDIKTVKKALMGIA